MTREEIKEKASLYFLLNPNNSEEEKNCVIEEVMATRSTIVPKVYLGNIIIYLQKQNEKLKAQIEEMKCCANCEYYSMEFLPYFCIKRQIPTHCTGYCDKWEIKE